VSWFRYRGRAPLAIGAFIAIPLFFSALMASTLAQEKPRVVQWGGHNGNPLYTTYHEPAANTEVRIWLWALVPSLVLVLIGFLSMRLPYGFYVVCVSAIVIALAVVHKVPTWEKHHTERFPNGVDLIPKSNPGSNKWDPGQWEAMARDTAVSLSHWTIGVALAAIVVTAGIAVKKRWFSRKTTMPEPPPLEGIHGPDVTMPGL
jgi:hypothetical protein